MAPGCTRLIEIGVQPADDFLLIGFGWPAAYTVPGAFHRVNLAGVPESLEACTHIARLLNRYQWITGAVNQEERRHVGPEMLHRRQLRQAGQDEAAPGTRVEILADGIRDETRVLGQGGKICRRVKSDHRLDGKSGIERSHGRKMAAGGFSDERDASGVNVVFVRVGREELNGGFHIANGDAERDGIFGEPVIDGKPGDAGAGEGFEQRRHFGAPVSPDPATTVNENGGGKWSGSIRDLRVEIERLTTGAGVFHAAHRFSRVSSSRKHEGEKKSTDAEEHQYYRDA
jgi:hypothetical protein